MKKSLIYWLLIIQSLFTIQLHAKKQDLIHNYFLNPLIYPHTYPFLFIHINLKIFLFSILLRREINPRINLLKYLYTYTLFNLSSFPIYPWLNFFILLMKDCAVPLIYLSLFLKWYHDIIIFLYWMLLIINHIFI